MTPEERQRVDVRLGGGVICDRCGATLATYPDRCSAALDDPCPGFRAIEAAAGATAAGFKPDVSTPSPAPETTIEER